MAALPRSAAAADAVPASPAPASAVSGAAGLTPRPEGERGTPVGGGPAAGPDSSGEGPGAPSTESPERFGTAPAAAGTASVRADAAAVQPNTQRELTPQRLEGASVSAPASASVPAPAPAPAPAAAPEAAPPPQLGPAVLADLALAGIGGAGGAFEMPSASPVAGPQPGDPTGLEVGEGAAAGQVAVAMRAGLGAGAAVEGGRLAATARRPGSSLRPDDALGARPESDMAAPRPADALPGLEPPAPTVPADRSPAQAAALLSSPNGVASLVAQTPVPTVGSDAAPAEGGGGDAGTADVELLASAPLGAIAELPTGPAGAGEGTAVAPAAQRTGPLGSPLVAGPSAVQAPPPSEGPDTSLLDLSARIPDRVELELQQGDARLLVHVDRDGRRVDLRVEAQGVSLSSLQESEPALGAALDQQGFHLGSFSARSGEGQGRGQRPSVQPAPAPAAPAKATPKAATGSRLVDRYA